MDYYLCTVCTCYCLLVLEHHVVNDVTKTEMILISVGNLFLRFSSLLSRTSFDNRSYEVRNEKRKKEVRKVTEKSKCSP